MENDRKQLLDSPITFELASELEIQKVKEEVNLLFKSKKLKKRKSVTLKDFKIPKIKPIRSIYEETNLNNLTKRQRILVENYNKNKRTANSLFLAVYDLNPSMKKKAIEENELKLSVTLQRCIKCYYDTEDLYKFLKWITGANLTTDLSIVSETKKKIGEILKHNKCICNHKHELYNEISDYLETNFNNDRNR